jgi:hypothetical protein
MTTCLICYDSISTMDSTLCCSLCDQMFCMSCIETYIVFDVNKKPSCPHCNKLWSFEFILRNLSKDFKQNVYFPFYANQKFEEEKQLLPMTQPIATLHKRRCEINELLSTYPTKKQIEKIRNPEIRNEKMLKYLNEKQVLEKERRGILELMERTPKQQPKEVEIVIPRYIMKCREENCKGFVSNTYCCELCHQSVCKHCLEIVISPEHRCNRETLRSVSLIAEITKPCPECFVPIMKKDGCNDMFCNICGTPFHWVTGKKITGMFHNPHEIEWLLKHPEQDFGCIEPTLNDFLRVVRIKLYNSPYIHHNRITSIFTKMNHIEYVVLPSLRPNIRDKIKMNQDLRIDYLLNKITDDEFRSKLLFREKKTMKLESIYNIIQLFHTIYQDFVKRIIHLPNQTLQDILNEYYKASEYIEDLLDKCVSIHGGKIQEIVYTAFIE